MTDRTEDGQLQDMQAHIQTLEAEIDRLRAELAETIVAFLQMLLDCDAVQAGGNPNESGLCDAIDNDGCHYQSAAMAEMLDAARKAGIRPTLCMEKAPVPSRDDEEAMRQALEALDWYAANYWRPEATDNTIDALRERLS